MSDLASHLDKDTMIVLIVFGIMGTVAIVAITAGVWYHWRKHELEATLKAELIKQGRSVEDIERVLRASSKTDKDYELQQKVIKAALKEGKTADEIDRMLRSI